MATRQMYPSPTRHPQRNGDPSFNWQRFLRALLVKDSRPAEIFMGLFVIAARGAQLANHGFVYPEVGRLLDDLTITGDRLGALLILCGIAQVVATGTAYRHDRPVVAFLASILCFLGYVAYLGANLGASAVAYSWAGLFLAEVALCWRILLGNRIDDPDE